MEQFLNEHNYVHNIFEDKVSTLEDELDMDIYEISKPEVEENLANINPLLESINENGLPNEDVNKLKRYLHTLKGSVRMAGANKVGMVAHRLESLLDYVQKRHLNIFLIKEILEKEVHKIVFLMSNVMVEFDNKTRRWLDEVEVVSDNLLEDVDISELVTTEKGVASVVKVQQIPFINRREQRQVIRVFSDVLDNAVNEAGEIRLSRTALEGALVNNRRGLAELKESSVKIMKMLRELEIQAESQIQARQELLGETGANFDPLEFDRFTRLQELTRLMNEAVIDVTDTVSSLETLNKLQESTVSHQSTLTIGLLDTLMKVRLIPLETITDRLYKITRSTAKEVGKPTTLTLVGEKTEIDRLVLDRVTPALEHLLRNCIAHGVETSADRLSLGKSAMGRVEIDTSVAGNFIIIKVSDDGSGIDLDKVKEKGLSLGLLSPNKQYPREEIINLIFHPGFTTADKVSQVSGRGVGMDVVKSEIGAIGGNVTVTTEEGKGSVFQLVIPVTVAHNHSMLSSVMGKMMAIPAMMIEQVYSVKNKDLIKAYQDGFITIDNEKMDMLYFGHLLGLLSTEINPEIKHDNQLVKVKYLNETLLIHVDKIETTQEILIKPLGPVLNRVSGLLGASLLGDGRQVLLVNPVLLKTHYISHFLNNKIHSMKNEDEEMRKSQITVMVVDDSLTIRRASQKMLERNGYRVVLGKDGADALEQLQLLRPDIILSDIEMPRMDGFEFVKNIKNTEKYLNIPVIMITSRTADKHKELAFSLGANGFLGKPYREEELLANINILLKDTTAIIR